MSKLQKLSKDPNYEKTASSFSKLTMAIFFLSYVYFVITKGGNPGGWLNVILFLIVGLFASSLFIAAPLFIIKKLFPKISFLIIIANILITFFITKYAFLWLLT